MEKLKNNYRYEKRLSIIGTASANYNRKNIRMILQITITQKSTSNKRNMWLLEN